MARKNNTVHRGPLEKEIQNTICEWLEFNGYFFWRSNNVPVYARNGAGKMAFRKLPKYTPRGLPDIIIIHRGVFVGLEVKREYRGLMSPDQVAFRHNCSKAGGLYYVVHNLEEVLAINFLSSNKLLP